MFVCFLLTLLLGCNKENKRVITRNYAGSIIEVQFTNYIDYSEYIQLNAKIFSSDYFICDEDYLVIGNKIITHKNREFKIQDVTINSDNEKVLNLYSPSFISGFSYYDNYLKRINIMPNIEHEDSFDAEIDIYKDAIINNYDVDQLYIRDIINESNLNSNTWYFILEGNGFDNKNIITNLTEYIYDIEGD